MLCERVNYRFWFAYDGTPCFKPAPIAATAVIEFTLIGHLAGLSTAQDLGQIKNRISIEGLERAMYAAKEDKASSRFKATASDAASIASYLEHTETIQNKLFQDQDSIDAMCAARLAERKDPKWYADIDVSKCPVPLEVGDTISWMAGLETGGTPIEMTGIIVSINLSKGKASYTCEMRSTAMNIANYATGPVTVNAEHCNGWMLTNAGASGDVQFNLPAAVVGMQISFYVLAAQTLTINPNGTERIAVITGTAGDFLRSDNVIGSCITLVCLVAGYWHCLDKNGTWTEE
jgi:hypothetical protein